MFGAPRFLWPLALLAATPLFLIGCGGGADPNAATQFRPVDDEEPAAPKKSKPANDAKPPVAVGEPRAETQPKRAQPPTNPGTAKASTKAGSQGSDAKAADSDPALAGATGAKVRRMRSLFSSLQGEQEGTTEEEQRQTLFGRLQQTMVTADEVLAEATAPAEARDEARATKFQVAFMILSGGLDQDAKEIFKQAAADLANAENVQLASLGRAQLFELHVRDILKSQPADAEEVLTALDTLLEAGVDLNIVINKVLPLISDLEGAGYRKEGVAAISKIGDHFAASKNDGEALFGKQVQISGLIGQMRTAKEGEVEKLSDDVVSAAKDLVETSKSDPAAMGLLNQHAGGLQGDFPEVAGKLYDLIEEQYGESGDKKVASKATELVENGRKRLGLIGKPLEVTGVQIGGEAFDWSEYQGKVVLVHFWVLPSQTNAGQANLQDLASKMSLHQRHARRGLNIVGVNLDLNTSKVEEMFADQPLPWPNVTGENLSQRGSKHPTAKACGVTADTAPFSVLIGKDGNVVAAGLQGKPLDDAIVKLLSQESVPTPENGNVQPPSEDEPERSEKPEEAVGETQGDDK